MVLRSRLDDENLSPEQMQEWLRGEIYGVAKATELRLQAASQFVTDYARGALNPEDAMGKLLQYESRWGDSPVPGVLLDSSMTNEEIIERMDKYRLKERLRGGGNIER